MLTQEEIKELKFFSDKVVDVHGWEHNEYIRINEIIMNSDFLNIKDNDFEELKILTNNFIIPEWACRAQETLLKLLKKIN